MLGLLIQLSLHTYFLVVFYIHMDIFFLLYFLFGLHFPVSNVHLQSHEICFTNTLDSLNPVIILNAVMIISLDLLGIHNLSDGSSRVQQLIQYLNKIQVGSDAVHNDLYQFNKLTILIKTFETKSSFHVK